MLTRPILTGLLALSLTACGGLSGSNPTLPPSHLLESCWRPAPPAGRTNADLANLAQGLQLALDLCDADKAALRAWAEELQ